MKKLLLVIVLCLIPMNCGTPKKASSWVNIGVDGYMVEDVEKIVSIKELYEICEIERLSTNLNEWAAISYYDNDSEMVSQWFYIKDTDTNKFYLLAKDTDSTFTFKIREIIPE